MDKLLKKLEYKVNSISLIEKAFVHSSYANEKNTVDNERLEFLGDAVLELIVSTYLYNNCIDLDEGQMTRLRANIVCERNLAYCANLVDLGDYILLGKGEKANGGGKRKSILSDTFEALIGAIYLDSGYKIIEKIVLKNIVKPYFHREKTHLKDYKTLFQEKIQGMRGYNVKDVIEYVDIYSEGPDHNKIFYVELKVGNRIFSKGNGHSKKQAQQNAAKKAFEKLQNNKI